MTMVYNEGRAVQRWIEYYANQVGASNCFIVDHGSDDGSTASVAPVSVLKIPRSPHDDARRAQSISHLANSLLFWYDYVIYVDCDEFLVADPRKYKNLQEYCEIVKPDYVTSIGINVIHIRSKETGLVAGKPILSQRSYGMFVSPMCKPSLTGIPVLWNPGFHFRDKPALFGDIFLFHLRYADADEALTRLTITRNMSWQASAAGLHQRLAAEDYLRRLDAWAAMPVVEDDPWSSTSGLLHGYTAAMTSGEFFAPHRGIYFPADEFRHGVLGKELLRIPDAFREIL